MTYTHQSGEDRIRSEAFLLLNNRGIQQSEYQPSAGMT
jgi:hypothetical protein